MAFVVVKALSCLLLSPGFEHLIKATSKITLILCMRECTGFQGRGKGKDIIERSRVPVQFVPLKCRPSVWLR